MCMTMLYLLCDYELETDACMSLHKRFLALLILIMQSMKGLSIPTHQRNLTHVYKVFRSNEIAEN